MGYTRFPVVPVMTTSILLHMCGSLADFDIILHGCQNVKHNFSFLRKFFRREEDGNFAVPRVPKKLRRIFRVSGKQSEKHFPPGRVPGGKYLSGCKCASCAPTAHKECAQQTAKKPSKSPKGDFRRPEGGLRPSPTSLKFYDCAVGHIAFDFTSQ